MPLFTILCNISLRCPQNVSVKFHVSLKYPTDHFLYHFEMPSLSGSRNTLFFFTFSGLVDAPGKKKKHTKKNILAQMSFICHIHNYTEYNQQWNVFSAFNPSKCTHTWSSGQPTLRCPGSSFGGSVPCSRVSPQSWTIPARAEIRTHNLRLQVRRFIH